MAIQEMIKAQNDWQKYINDKFAELDGYNETVEVDSPIDFIDGATGHSHLRYVQLKDKKLVSLWIVDITMPAKMATTWASHIGQLPDQFIPEDEVQHSVKERAHLHLYDNGQISCWINNDDGKDGNPATAYSFQATYFTKN